MAHLEPTYEKQIIITKSNNKIDSINQMTRLNSQLFEYDTIFSIFFYFPIFDAISHVL